MDGMVVPMALILDHQIPDLHLTADHLSMVAALMVVAALIRSILC